MPPAVEPASSPLSAFINMDPITIGLGVAAFAAAGGIVGKKRKEKQRAKAQWEHQLRSENARLAEQVTEARMKAQTAQAQLQRMQSSQMTPQKPHRSSSSAPAAPKAHSGSFHTNPYPNYQPRCVCPVRAFCTPCGPGAFSVHALPMPYACPLHASAVSSALYTPCVCLGHVL